MCINNRQHKCGREGCGAILPYTSVYCKACLTKKWEIKGKLLKQGRKIIEINKELVKNGFGKESNSKYR